MQIHLSLLPSSRGGRSLPSECEVPESWKLRAMFVSMGVNETDPVSSTQLLISKDFSFCNG